MKDPAKDEVIQSLKNKLIEIRKNLSLKRKNGEYTKLAEIMLISIPAKIKLIEVDFQSNYVDDIKNIFKEVEEDLKTQYP